MLRKTVLRILTVLVVPVLIGIGAAGAQAPGQTIRIVALGDSLTAGFRLDGSDAFPAQLEARLRARGHDVEIVNAGVSGDTSSGGLARIDWSVGPDADAVILALGGNDAMRGIDPAITRAALGGMLARLGERGLPVLLAGIVIPPALGQDYADAFNAIYPELADEYGALYYRFFLDGVASNPALNLEDGVHPNEDGVAVMVDRILPTVEELLARAYANVGTVGAAGG